jgi:hypothetical protein
MSTAVGKFFTNQNLFSTNYLENRLPKTGLWKEADEPAAQILQAATAAYRDVHSLKLGPGEEANLEYRFIRPVFKALGFECDIQPVTRRGTRKKRPDYALFASEADLKTAREEKDNLQRFFSAPAKFHPTPSGKKVPRRPPPVAVFNNRSRKCWSTWNSMPETIPKTRQRSPTSV